MKLSLVSIEKAGYVRIATEGDITSADLLDLREKNPLEGVLGASWASNNILLNLSKSAFIDSSAIGWLLESHRKLQQSGGKLVPHSAQPRVGELFDLLKLRRVLNLKDDEKSAQDFLIGAGTNQGGTSGGGANQGAGA
jgi:anti-anti-sigma factor